MGVLTIKPLVSQADKSWPYKHQEPIKIIVTFTPGGAPDILARVLAEAWQKEFHVQVMVENRPGAGGNIGAEMVAKAEPNGHTLLLSTIGILTINPYLYNNLNYDASKQLEAITFLASTPNVVVVPKDSPLKDFKALIEYSKTHPLNYSSSGIGTSHHLSGELIHKLTGGQLNHIPYRGRAQALPDLLSGRLHMSIDNLSSSLPFIRSGELRALGVTSHKRATSAKEIPTISESGIRSLKDFNVTSWFALSGPANMANDDIQRIYHASFQALVDPETKQKLMAMSLDPDPQGPVALKKLIQYDSKRWSKLIQELQLKAE